MNDRGSGVRDNLLEAALWFVRAAADLPGVRRIALIGSIMTGRASPKDVDLVVYVPDDLDLTTLAALGRRLKGRLQSHSRGADVFLADARGRYIGRTCSWKVCRPGVQASCDALHCGRRPYLHDDLKTVRLADALIAAPPLELWPAVVRRCTVPADVEQLLASLAEPHNNRLQATAGGSGGVGQGVGRSPAAPEPGR
jgi:hypothetical protein